MTDPPYILLKDGPYKGKQVNDPDVRIHEEDVIHIDGETEAWYVVDIDCQGKQVSKRAKVYGRTWNISSKDLLP